MPLRTIYITFSSVLFIFLFACRTPKQAYFELPAEMLEPVKVEYAKICDKGRALYEITCAGCHTTTKRGKEIIPDFTAVQLEAYQIRVANSTHETRVTEEQVSAEELSYILTYLSYKTKSNVMLKSSNPKPKENH
ncbi:MAG: cytochrome c [Bacteroidota bacterium]